MKKRKLWKVCLSFSLIFCMLLSIPGCSKETTSKKEEPKEETTTETVPEAETQKEQLPTVTEEETPTTSGPQPVTLTSSEQYEINLFLSNFSEQQFGNYDQATSTDEQLLPFAFIYTSINRPDVQYYEGSYTCMNLDDINYAYQRFFNKTFLPEEGRTYAKYYLYENGKLKTPSASGASHGILTIVDSLTLNTDGTYNVTFKDYEFPEFNTGGNMIPSKDYYYMTAAQAESSSEMRCIATGTAVVQRKDPNKTNSYFLLKYDVTSY